jgi:Na+/H+ antiporter NhaD/arsenite permease-like protein
VSSNPTNLVISGAFGLSHFVYSAYMILPTLFAAIFMFVVLYVQFSGIVSKRSNLPFIPSVIVLPEGTTADARSFLVDKTGAVIGTTLMLTTLAVLVATGPLKPTIPVWRITMPGALIMFLRDISYDWSKRGPRLPPPSALSREDHPEVQRDELELDNTVRLDVQPTQEQAHVDHALTGGHIPQSPISPSRERAESKRTLSSSLRRLNIVVNRTFPTTYHIVTDLPVSLLLFALSMFILVQAPLACGWLDVFARWWERIEVTCGVAGSVFIMTILSSLLCSVRFFHAYLTCGRLMMSL